MYYNICTHAWFCWVNILGLIEFGFPLHLHFSISNFQIIFFILLVLLFILQFSVDFIKPIFQEPLPINCLFSINNICCSNYLSSSVIFFTNLEMFFVKETFQFFTYLLSIQLLKFFFSIITTLIIILNFPQQPTHFWAVLITFILHIAVA